MAAWYTLGPDGRNRINRVALPNATRSSPVAKGSSVPVWPAFTPPRARRTIATTSWELTPAGLSTSNTPSRFAVGIFAQLVGADLLQQRVDARGVGDAVVIAEIEFRCDTQPQRAPQFRPEMSRHRGQAFHRCLLLHLRAEDTDVYPRVPEVARDVHPRYRYEPGDARILDALGEEHRDGFPDRLGDTIGTT